jgi:hypothetical protein
MCENVAAHAWSPPNFPDSEMTESAPIGTRPLQKPSRNTPSCSSFSSVLGRAARLNFGNEPHGFTDVSTKRNSSGILLAADSTGCCSKYQSASLCHHQRTARQRRALGVQIRVVAGFAEVSGRGGILLTEACNYPNLLGLPFSLELILKA